MSTRQADRSVDETDDFEIVRQDALRQFRIDLANGEHVFTFAHYHDAGQNVTGHLSFVIVDPHGINLIDRVFSVHSWRQVQEVVNPQSTIQQRADVRMALNQKLRDKQTTH